MYKHYMFNWFKDWFKKPKKELVDNSTQEIKITLTVNNKDFHDVNQETISKILQEINNLIDKS